MYAHELKCLIKCSLQMDYLSRPVACNFNSIASLLLQLLIFGFEKRTVYIPVTSNILDHHMQIAKFQSDILRLLETQDSKLTLPVSHSAALEIVHLDS